MALKKAIISVMLSALLIGSTAIPVYAVDDTTNNMDTEEVLLEEEEEDGGTEDGDTEDTVNTDDAETGQQEGTDTEQHDDTDTEQQDDTEDKDVGIDNDNATETDDTDKTDSKDEETDNKDITDEGTGKTDSNDKTDNKDTTDTTGESEETDNKDITDEGTGKTDSNDKTDNKDTTDTTGESEESKTEIKEGKQNIEISVKLNCDVASTTGFEGTVDYSKLKLTLLSADGKTVIKVLDTYDKLSENRTTSYVTFSVEVPDWGRDDIRYILRAENLPSVYKQSTYDMPFECKIQRGEYGDTLNGITYPVSLSIDNIIDYTDLIFVYDRSFNLVGNIPIRVRGYDKDDRLIYSATVKSNNDGYAFLNLSDKIDDIKSIQFSSDAIINGGVITGEVLYEYSRDAKFLGIKGNYMLRADTDYKDLLVDDEGNKYSEVSTVKFKATFSNMDDMSLFRDTNIQVALYSGDNLFNSMVFNKSNNSQELELVSGSKYTVRGVNSIDYDVRINNQTLVVSDGIVMNIEAVPQLKLKVVNKDNKGQVFKAHFRVEGVNAEYNDIGHIFSVNKNSGYKIYNLDTGVEYDVFVGQNKETEINIYDGFIKYAGTIDNIGNNESNDSTITNTDTNYNSNVNYVPKTGDIVFSIIMILTGITGLSYLGYLYFKRKGKNANEVKK